MTGTTFERRQATQMEGRMARWYTKLRGTESQVEAYRRQAVTLTAGLDASAHVLEVAPGPGYMAVEIARLGFHVTGLDSSRTFVEIASENARQAAVSVDFHHGDAARLPFEAASFDLIVCQAAFKNFGRPLAALDEMHRVLRSGGAAVIDDMSGDASGADIRREVATMGVSPLNAFMTRRTLTMLRRRAYSPSEFRRLAAESAFGACEIHTDGIGMQVRLERQR